MMLLIGHIQYSSIIVLLRKELDERTRDVGKKRSVYLHRTQDNQSLPESGIMPGFGRYRSCKV
jgi:hypothetical protein